MLNLKDIETLFKASPTPNLILLPDAPRFTIASVNEAYCIATNAIESDLLNKGLLDFFPDESETTGVKNLKTLEKVIATKSSHKTEVQKYEVPVRGTAGFEVKYWSLQNFPVFNDKGEMIFIIVSVTDNTNQLLNSRESTEKERAVETLKSSEERYRNLFHNNPLPMWIYDSETYRFLEVNQSAIETYGYSQNEFLKMTIKDIRPVEDTDLLTTVKGTGTNYGIRYEKYWRHLKKDGQLLYADITSRIINHEDRKATLIMAHDVTEKVKAGEDIRKSEEVNRLIMNSALDAIISMDSDGVVTLWNTQAEKLFGWTSEEIIGKDLADYIIPGQYRQRHKQGVKSYLETGKSSIINKVVEVSAIDRHQIEFPIELIIVHIKKEGSDFFCAFIRDITECKHHATALKLSEQRFKALVQEGSDLISILDHEKQYKYLSPAYTSILGIKPEELPGNKASNRIHEDDRDRVSETSELLKTEKRVQYLPFRYRDGCNQYRWLESVATNLTDDPSVEGILVNSKDITERINYIQAIEAQNAKLTEIAWTQSHIVRAPLSRIMGLADLIINYSEDGINTKELFKSLLTSAYELDGIVRSIVQKTEQIKNAPEKMTQLNDVRIAN